MDPFTLAMIGLAAYNAYSSYESGQRQQTAIEQETAENVRRMQLAQGIAKGSAEVAAGASGINPDSGSLASYLHTMSSEFENQINWLRRAGAAQASAAGAAGEYRAVADVGSALLQAGARNKWFNSPSVNKPSSGGFVNSPTVSTPAGAGDYNFDGSYYTS